MSTNIEWTDVTDNLIAVKGGGWWCRKISPGCKFCYAEKLNKNAFYGGNMRDYSGQPPELIFRREIIASWARQRVAKKHFVCSMTDVFGDWVPQDWINEMLIGMVLAPNQTFQVLTKRIDVALEKITAFLKLAGADRLPPNVWIGTSVENQKYADERIPLLLEIPAHVRFLSMEPLLGPVRIDHIRRGDNQWFPLQHLHWVIVGGESGTKARPMLPDWARSLRDQCSAAEVAFMFKQWGRNHPLSTSDGRQMLPFGDYALPSEMQPKGFGFIVAKKDACRRLDGREWNKFPTSITQ